MKPGLNPTRARFIAAIADRAAEADVVEVHVFAPIKQGGIESGVAVVAVDSGEGEPPAERREPSAESRLTVYTATYRLTLKGPERGKWDFAMNAEADAPLVTVDAVVRGVQRRSGDVDEPEKFGAEEFRDLLTAARAQLPAQPAK